MEQSSEHVHPAAISSSYQKPNQQTRPALEGYTPESNDHRHSLPFQHQEKEKKEKPVRFTRKIHPDGESGRKGFHPFHFFHVCIISSSTVSMWLNVLWPVVPAAIAVHFAIPDRHVVIFVLNYIAMIPAANTIGFAGQELARKIPKVLGVLIETTLGSLVEIILFIVLIVRGNQNIPVVRAAILGSILANLLLCMGLCFIAGGMRHREQEFHEAISEVGNGLLLVAAMGLVAPAAFATVVNSSQRNSFDVLSDPDMQARVIAISRATAIILLIAYIIYVVFSMSSHHSLITEVLEGDEELDRDRERDLSKKKLTLSESILALVFAIACVSLIAVFLVQEIEYIVEARGISDAFMGLILVPLVEKVAEHATAVDEAWDNQANFALAHVLGASVQTALLNTPVVVLVGWGLGREMDLDFRQFDAIVLVLAVIVVGNFLRDGKSNYLEGSLCVLVYVIVAVCAFYYPNPVEADADSSVEGSGTATETSVEAARVLVRAAATTFAR